MTQPQADVFEDAVAEFFGADDSEPATPAPEVEEPETETPEVPAPDGGDESPEELDDDADDDAEPEAAEQHADDATVIEVPAGAKLRLADGTEVDADESALRQADYTRKTTEVARQREENEARKAELDAQETRLVEYIEARQGNPAAWVAEIIAQAQEPSVTIARALKQLAQSGRLDPQFAQVFGLESGAVAEYAERGSSDERIAAVEENLRRQEQARLEQERHQQVIAEYQRQYRSIVESDGLTFESPEAENQFRSDLLTYARDHQITNLEVAYRAWAYENRRSPQPEPAPVPDPAVQQKKRAARAVSSKSAATPGVKPAQPSGPITTTDAIEASLEEFMGRS